MTASSRARQKQAARPFGLLKWLAIALIAGLLALLVWSVVAGKRGSELVHAIAAGKKPAAPAFALPVIWTEAPTWPAPARRLLTHGKLALSALRGRPVVLNFWASWCAPCKDEAPLLAEVAREYAGRVLFLGIDTQDLRSDARAFARKYGIDYASVADISQQTYSVYGLTGVPETYFLDARGRIVAHTPGEVVRSSLVRGIRAALAAR